MEQLRFTGETVLYEGRPLLLTRTVIRPALWNNRQHHPVRINRLRPLPLHQ